MCSSGSNDHQGQTANRLQELTAAGQFRTFTGFPHRFSSAKLQKDSNTAKHYAENNALEIVEGLFPIPNIFNGV